MLVYRRNITDQLTTADIWRVNGTSSESIDSFLSLKVVGSSLVDNNCIIINSNEFPDSCIAASELTEDVIVFVNSAKLWTESLIVDLTWSKFWT